jgi:hypothetical protein
MSLVELVFYVFCGVACFIYYAVPVFRFLRRVFHG